MVGCNKKTCKSKTRLALLLLLCTTVWLKSSAQTTFTEGHLYYSVNIDGTTVSLTGHVDGTAASGTLEIPESVSYGGTDYAVTLIADNAFSHCSNLTGELVIPNTVIEVGYAAFQGCGFSGLRLGNSLRIIGNSAFNMGAGVSFGELILPASLVSIGSLSFSGFNGILHIHSNIASIGQGAFYGCAFDAFEVDAGNPRYTAKDGVLFSRQLDTIMAYPAAALAMSYDIPPTVKRIEAYTFSQCLNLTSIDIPNSVTAIGAYAFAWCSNITEFCIPESVVEVYKSSFFSTSWMENQTSNVVYLDGWCIGRNGPAYLTGELVIEEGTKGIAGGAFSVCTGLTSVTFPSSLRIIGASAFNACTGLSGELILPDGLENIAAAAFNSCTGLTGNLVLPAALKSVGGNAFYNCPGFTGDLVIPNSVETIYNRAFQTCTGFDGQLILGNSLTSIGDYAFSNCNNLKGLSFGDSVKDIGYAAFANCSGFTGELLFPNSVTEIGAFAFFGCEGFTGDLAIPSLLTIIREGIFSGGNAGFNGNLLIPKSVKEIHDQAFYGCSQLQSITVYCETPPVIIKDWPEEEEGPFYGIEKSIPVYVQCNSSNEYQSSSYWDEFTNYQENLLYNLELTTNMPAFCTVSILQQPSCDLQAIVQAVPAEGYVFVAWEEDGVIVANDSIYSFTVDHDVLLFARVKSETGLTEYDALNSSVYPNPTKGMVVLEAEGLKHVSITNLDGQQLFNGDFVGNTFEYDFGKHKAGVYLIRIETRNGAITKQIIVN